MKIITFIFLVSLSFDVCAQKSIFVRVYDLAGNKINKGHVFNVTDSSLQLDGNPEIVNIPVQNIGSIKTKHSLGNNVLVGSIIGVTTIAIVGAASTSSDQGIIQFSAGEGAAGGAIIGLPVGAVLGLLTTVFKNSKYFIINGDITKLKAFELAVVQNNK